MPALTTFISEIKKLDQSNYLIQDLGDLLIKEAITDALREYSEYVPRGFRTTTITIAVGNEEIELPSDCLHIDDETAHLLTYGYSRGEYRVPGAYPLRSNNSAYSTDSIYGLTTDPAQSTSQADPVDIPLSTNNEGSLCIVLSEAATAARSHEIRYQAYHSITNSPDVNTVPPNDRRRVRQLVLGYMAQARSRQAKNREEADRWMREAQQNFKVREEFNTALGSIWN